MIKDIKSNISSFFKLSSFILRIDFFNSSNFFDNPSYCTEREILMMTKKKDNRLKLTLQIDEDILKSIKNLRDKHHVNISAICRDAITEWERKLEGVK